MRDPARINKFCDDLKVIWHCVPDWRFGQLMSNIISSYMAENKRDVFYIEDDDFMKFIMKYISSDVSPYYSPEEVSSIVKKDDHSGGFSSLSGPTLICTKEELNRKDGAVS